SDSVPFFGDVSVCLAIPFVGVYVTELQEQQSLHELLRLTLSLRVPPLDLQT
ncbi:hypothetical protein U1Q18_023562, partial [Sarracenia purpurea var. burkii]